MANISDGLSRGYVNLCKAVLGDAFVTLKQVAFPYVQGNHVRLLPKRSTSLIDLTIRCCTKHALYLILEKLSNLERFSVDPGTLDVRRMVGQYFNLKELYLPAYIDLGIMNVVTPYLIRVYHVPNTSTIIKQFSQQLETYVHQRYTASLSYLNIYRIRKELNLVKSIRYRLEKEKYTLHVTDKSGVFHIVYAQDYKKKAKAHRQRTGAYIELATNPLSRVYDKIVHLLNNLRSNFLGSCSQPPFLLELHSSGSLVIYLLRITLK